MICHAIALIGMPAAGKSTVGRLLAERLAWRFFDTDRLIEQRCGQTLQQLLDAEGYLALRSAEEEAILSLSCAKTIVATGGSAVYSAAAMAHLQSHATLVYLSVSEPQLAERLGDWSERGIAAPPDCTLAQLYAERSALYRRYADHCIDCTSLSPAATVDAVVACQPSAS